MNQADSAGRARTFNDGVLGYISGMRYISLEQSLNASTRSSAHPAARRSKSDPREFSASAGMHCSERPYQEDAALDS